MYNKVLYFNTGVSMEIKELLEEYKKDELFMSFNPNAESEINDFSLLLEKAKKLSLEEYSDEKVLNSYLVDTARSKLSETAWLYLIHQCKKITDNSERKEITISNKSFQYKNCIVYRIEDGKKKHIVALPCTLENLNMSIENKEIKAGSFIKDIESIMETIHAYVIRSRIENFTKFNSYCEKINLEKLLSEQSPIQDMELNKKRL